MQQITKETLSSLGDFGVAVRGLLDSDRSPKSVSKHIPDVPSFVRLWNFASQQGVDDRAMDVIVTCPRSKLSSLTHVPVYAAQKLAERLDARMMK